MVKKLKFKIFYRQWILRFVDTRFVDRFLENEKSTNRRMHCILMNHWQWSFLDKNKGTSYVELELFTTKSSSNCLTIFDVRIDGLKYEKNEKLIGQKVSFEMNRFKDKFKLSTYVSTKILQNKIQNKYIIINFHCTRIWGKPCCDKKNHESGWKYPWISENGK